MIIRIPVLDNRNKALSLRSMAMAFREIIGERIPDGVRVGFDGDPALNECTNVLLIKLAKCNAYPVIETTMPKQREDVSLYMNAAINLLNECYPGRGELRIHIGSTSESERKKLFGDVTSLAELSKLFEKYPKPKERKVILMLDAGKQADIEKLSKFFPSDLFSVGIHGESSSEETEEEIRAAGYEIFQEEVDDGEQ